MDWTSFQLGFWHTFGAHGGEERDEILARKAEEIAKNNGWTLWSFQPRRMISVWQSTLPNDHVGAVFALCSDSPSARDPRGAVTQSTHYRLTESGAWLPIPQAIRIPHPFGRRQIASAFMVESIEHLLRPEGQPPFRVAWMARDRTWRDDGLPARGEYLIKRGGAAAVRRVYAVLTLRWPFVVWLRA